MACLGTAGAFTLKLNVTINGESCGLQLELRPSHLTYALKGVIGHEGEASVAEVRPGTFSVLLGTRSITARVVSGADGIEVWIGEDKYSISFPDTRDRAERTTRQANKGPLQIRALMPGRIVRLLVGPGDLVQPEQGLIVVEAMKMQNEMKTPRAGTVAQIFASEGAIVAAGEKLMVIE